MNTTSRPVLAFRWLTFVLALGYSIYQLGTGDWAAPGGPLRYLTIWALLFSTLSAAGMLLLSLGRTQRSFQVIAMTASVFNVMVVFLYWKLFFIDPKLVNNNGEIVWHQQYYLHAVGPALQLCDAVFISRVYRRVWRGAVALCVLVPCYVMWAELFVQRFNAVPLGKVTSGLPYPFLNNMEGPDRAMFYLMYGGVALGILGVLTLLTWCLNRLHGARDARVH